MSFYVTYCNYINLLHSKLYHPQWKWHWMKQKGFVLFILLHHFRYPYLHKQYTSVRVEVQLFAICAGGLPYSAWNLIVDRHIMLLSTYNYALTICFSFFHSQILSFRRKFIIFRVNYKRWDPQHKKRKKEICIKTKKKEIL